ncbi:unnamed protein product [Gordionus sp. m RMFG-2023]
MGTVFSNYFDSSISDRESKILFRKYYGRTSDAIIDISSNSGFNKDRKRAPVDILSDKEFKNSWPFTFGPNVLIGFATINGFFIARILKNKANLTSIGFSIATYLGVTLPTLSSSYLGQFLYQEYNPILSTPIYLYYKSYNNKYFHNPSSPLQICPLCYELRLMMIHFATSTLVPLLTAFFITNSLTSSFGYYTKPSTMFLSLRNYFSHYYTSTNKEINMNGIAKNTFAYKNRYFLTFISLQCLIAIGLAKIQMDKSLNLLLSPESPHYIFSDKHKPY